MGNGWMLFITEKGEVRTRKKKSEQLVPGFFELPYDPPPHLLLCGLFGVERV